MQVREAPDLRPESSGRRRGLPVSHGTRYEFRVTGLLSGRAQEAVCDFGDLRVVQAPRETIIVGQLIDDSRLHGVLALFRSLGLNVVSVHRDTTTPDEVD